MMLYRLLKALCLGSACITVLACSSTTPSIPSFASPIDDSGWETKLPAKQGSVKITFTLPQRARAEFQLFNGKSSHSSVAVARVALSDENCTSGHLAAIHHKKARSDYYVKYFEKEAPWNNTNTITFAWNIDNHIITTLNNEIISTEVAGHVNRLKIISYLAPIDIQKIEYLSQ